MCIRDRRTTEKLRECVTARVALRWEAVLTPPDEHVLDALPELVWDDRFNLARYALLRRIAPALSPMFAFDTCLAVEDLDAVVHRVGEDRREARLIPADACRGHDLVVRHAVGGHLKGLDDAGRDLRIRNPANPGEGRSVVAGAHGHEFSPVAHRRPPARHDGSPLTRVRWVPDPEIAPR